MLMEIADRKIGGSCPCFIIAEAGINHNGDIDTAKKMIDSAKECGADAIKFQTFKAEEFVSDKDQKYSYMTQGKHISESMFKMFKRYEFNSKEFKQLSDYCRKRKIIFFSTPQNVGDLEILLKIGVPAIKVGSDDLTNLPLLESYAKKKVPILISSGMSYLSEIDEAVRTIGKYNAKLAIFHCVSSYPADPEELNLKRIKTLKSTFPNAIIGYSDHAQGIVPSICAVTLGAKLIEKHFTLDKGMFGPDHHLSADPVELRALVAGIREVEMSLGTSEIMPSKKEQKMRLLCRRSIVAGKDFNKGDLVLKEDIAFKRPGNGILPKNLAYIIGRKAKNAIPKDKQIRIEDLE